MEETGTRFPMPDRLVWLAGKVLVLCACFLYALVLFWTTPTVQGPNYDGPTDSPS